MKFEKLELEELHHDLTTAKALQLKHRKLEQIKDKVGSFLRISCIECI